MKKSIALIGYGYWGKTVFRYLEASSDFTLKYVHFRSLAGLSPFEIKQKYGPQFEPSLEKVLADPRLDAVMIATPIATHDELARKALLAGKHVLSEKPLTLDAQVAGELAELARQKKLALVTEYTQTFSPGLNKAACLVREGVIGRIRRVDIDWMQSGRFLEYDIYALLGSHALSIVDMFVPLAELTFEAKAKVFTNGLATEAEIAFQTLAKDAQGRIFLTLHSPHKIRRVKVTGDRGVLLFNPLETPVLAQGRTGNGDGTFIPERSFDFDEANNLALALRYFSQVIQSQEKGNIDSSVRITTLISQWGRGTGREKV